MCVRMYVWDQLEVCEQAGTVMNGLMCTRICPCVHAGESDSLGIRVVIKMCEHVRVGLYVCVCVCGRLCANGLWLM